MIKAHTLAASVSYGLAELSVFATVRATLKHHCSLGLYQQMIGISYMDWNANEMCFREPV